MRHPVRETNPGNCAREAEVVAAMISGSSLSDSCAVHLTECVSCAEAAAAMALLAEPVEVAVPPAGFVYRRAELRLRRERTEQAARPLQYGEWAATAVLAAGAAVGAVQSAEPLVVAAGLIFAGVLMVSAMGVRRAARHDGGMN